MTGDLAECRIPGYHHGFFFEEEEAAAKKYKEHTDEERDEAFADHVYPSRNCI